jgi:hypothetical protein
MQEVLEDQIYLLPRLWNTFLGNRWGCSFLKNSENAKLAELAALMKISGQIVGFVQFTFVNPNKYVNTARDIQKVRRA